MCSLLAVGVAVGLYFGLSPLLGTSEVGWVCILGAAPFAACGFFHYHGMTAETSWSTAGGDAAMTEKMMQARAMMAPSKHTPA